jgi:hypothetical protein
MTAKGRAGYRAGGAAAGVLFQTQFARGISCCFPVRDL